MVSKAIRFWVSHISSKGELGYVRLKLTEDRPELRWARGSLTDEGYAVEHRTFRLSDDRELVEHHWMSEGSDCDGPHQHGGVHVFPVEGYTLEEAYERPDILVPVWQSEESWLRDQYAESAGY